MVESKPRAEVRLALIFCPAAIALAVSAFAEPPPQPIATGYWEVQTQWLDLISTTERWCVQPKDISRFLSGPSNHIYHCRYPVSTAADGAIRFEGSCVDKKGVEIKLRGEGEYERTHVRMQAQGATQLLGIPVTGQASAEARLISPTCPPAAKAFQ